MTHREPVTAALKGKPLDRVPDAVSMHNVATENSAKRLRQRHAVTGLLTAPDEPATITVVKHFASIARWQWWWPSF